MLMLLPCLLPAATSPCSVRVLTSTFPEDPFSRKSKVYLVIASRFQFSLQLVLRTREGVFSAY